MGITPKSIYISRNAPAAVNPDTAGYLGKVMIENGVAGECVISGAAAGLAVARPLGVCVSVDASELGGGVTICTHGFCTADVGAVDLVKGADLLVESDGNGEIVTATGATVWTVGWWDADHTVTGQATGRAKVFVTPSIF